MNPVIRRLVNFWQQPFGVRHVLMIAAPLMVSTVCYGVMQFVDRIFLLQYSPTDAGAIAIIGTLVWTLCSLPLGVVTYVTTFVAQYRGAEQPSQVGRAVMHALYIAIACFPALLLPVLFIEDSLIWFGHDPVLARSETLCFRIYILSGLAMLVNGVFEGLLVGMERNRPVMLANIYATVLNIALDPLLIFGVGPLPALGIEGAAWATTISMWFKVVYTARVVLRLPEVSSFHFRRGAVFDGGFVRRYLFYGGPSGLQWFIEGIAIVYFIAVMGRLGEHYLTATSLAFSINMLAFVPIYGLGMGLTSIIGNQLGQDNPAMAKRAVRSALVIGLAYSGLFVILYTLFPQTLLILYRGNSDNFDSVEPLLLQILVFVAIYCIFDAIQIVKVSVLKGAGDTWFVTGTFVLTSILFVWIGSSGDYTAKELQAMTTILQEAGLQGPAGDGPTTPSTGLSVESAKAQLDTARAQLDGVAHRWWLALTGWIAALALIFSLRVAQGKWIHMKVIETPVK